MSRQATQHPRLTRATIKRLQHFRHTLLLTLPSVIPTPAGLAHLVPESEPTGQALYELPDGQRVTAAALVMARQQRRKPDHGLEATSRPQQLDLFPDLEELS